MNAPIALASLIGSGLTTTSPEPPRRPRPARPPRVRRGWHGLRGRSASPSPQPRPATGRWSLRPLPGPAVDRG
jgi:hypothetical protein